MSFRDLSARLAALGRPIAASQLHALSKGGRRVDSDALVAFARVFDVAPADLLAPEAASLAGHPVICAARAVAAQAEVLVRVADDSQAVGPASGYADRAIRRLQIEIEDLLA